MKIEAGKYYVTRGGDVVGPVSYYRPWGWQCPLRGGGTLTVGVSGKFAGDGIDHPNDLIKEHVMPKFKVGDRVRYSGGGDGEVIENHIWGHGRVTVKMDDGGRINANNDLFSIISAPALDLTKPVQTRDGRKVRVLCTDGPGELPVVGFIEGNVTTTQWPVGGEYYGGALRDFDLINTPAIPRTFERWFNVYTNEDTPTVILSLPRMNRKDADAMSILAAEHGTDSNFRRIARKRVVFTEGEWDE